MRLLLLPGLLPRKVTELRTGRLCRELKSLRKPPIFGSERGEFGRGWMGNSDHLELNLPF